MKKVVSEEKRNRTREQIKACSFLINIMSTCNKMPKGRQGSGGGSWEVWLGGWKPGSSVVTSKADSWRKPSELGGARMDLEAGTMSDNGSGLGGVVLGVGMMCHMGIKSRNKGLWICNVLVLGHPSKYSKTSKSHSYYLKKKKSPESGCCSRSRWLPSPLFAIPFWLQHVGALSTYIWHSTHSSCHSPLITQCLSTVTLSPFLPSMSPILDVCKKH